MFPITILENDVLTVEEVAEILQERNKTDKDTVFACTGDEGDGKSALAAGLGFAADPYFDFQRNELFSPTIEEMREKVLGLPKYSVVVADEAIKVLYKLNWASKGQKFLNELYAICRQENKMTVLCMPRFIDFNEFWRNHRIRYWAHIINPISNAKETGHAVLFEKTWNPSAPDPWYLKEMDSLIRQNSQQKKLRESDYSLDEKYRVLTKLPNFVGVIEFHWLNNVVWSEYLAIKKAVGYAPVELEQEEQPQRGLALKYRVMASKLSSQLLSKGVSVADIATLLSVTPAQLNRLLKSK